MNLLYNLIQNIQSALIGPSSKENALVYACTNRVSLNFPQLHVANLLEEAEECDYQYVRSLV